MKPAIFRSTQNRIFGEHSMLTVPQFIMDIGYEQHENGPLNNIAISNVFGVTEFHIRNHFEY